MRIIQRLQAADDALDEARAVFEARKHAYFMFKKYHEAEQRASAHPDDKQLYRESHNALLAWVRLHSNSCLRVSQGKFASKVRAAGIVDVVAEQLGLAQAWGVINIRDL